MPCHIDLTLNRNYLDKLGSSTSVPSGYLSGYSRLCCSSYLSNSLSLPVTRGLSSIESERVKLEMAQIRLVVAHIKNDTLGC